MSAPAQVMQLPFRGGLDKSTDPAQQSPGALERMQNAVWKKIGRIEKRAGLTHLSTTVLDGGAAMATIDKLLGRGDELVATAGGELFSYSPARVGWKRVQDVRQLEATWKTTVDSVDGAFAVDIDATASYRATAWFSLQRILLQVEDVASGTRLVAPVRIAAVTTIQAFRVLVLGTTVLVLFQRSGSNDINVVSVDLTTLAVAGVVVLRNDALNAGSTWDVCHNGANFTLAYRTSGNVLRVYTYNTALAQQATAVVEAVSFASVISLCATVGESLYVAFVTPGPDDVRVAVHNPATLAQTTAATLVLFTGAACNAITVSRASATTCVVAFTEPVVANNLRTFSVLVSNTAVVSASSLRCTRWAMLASKLFVLGTRMYMALASVRPAIMVGTTRLSQNTFFVVEIATSDASSFSATGGFLPHKLTSVISPREAATPFVPQPCGAPVVGSDAFVGALYVSGQVSVSGSSRNGVRLVKLSTNRSDPLASAEVGQALVTAGGANSVYDGRRQFELSFLHAPRVISATPGLGGSMTAGTYLYVFVYEWRDATGLLHRSIPSQPLSVAVAGGGKVDFVLESATTTGKADLSTGDGDLNALPVQIVAYRSVAAATSLFRLFIDGLDTPTRNVAGDESVAFTDTKDSANIDGGGTSLLSRPVLYTTGQILDEAMPPSFVTMTQHRGRLWGVAGDLRTIWYTKRFTEDPGVFPGFHESLRVVLDEDIVALASLDDKLVIFTAGAIYVVFGDGPAVTGLGSDLDGPNLVTGDIGCLSAPSVIGCPPGILFQASQGVYVLTRKLETVWIGRPVKDELDAFPTIKCAQLFAKKSQVRFGCADAAGTAGLVLVYDYENGFWSSFLYPTSLVPNIAVVDAVLYQTAGAAVAKEDDATCLDNGVWVTLDFEFTLAPIGPVAWQHMRRFQLLGERQTNHDLRLRLAFDHRATYAQDFTFTAQMTTTNNDCPNVRIGSQNGANPKCKALRVRVTDATPTAPGTYPVTTGKGGWFSAIGLEIIPMPGTPRRGARHTQV